MNLNMYTVIAKYIVLVGNKSKPKFVLDKNSSVSVIFGEILFLAVPQY